MKKTRSDWGLIILNTFLDVVAMDIFAVGVAVCIAYYWSFVTICLATAGGVTGFVPGLDKGLNVVNLSGAELDYLLVKGSWKEQG